MMTLSSTIACATTLLSLYLAAISLRLARARGWQVEGWVTVISLFSAVFIAMDIPTTLSVSDELIVIASDVRTLAAGFVIAAWSIYSRLTLGKPAVGRRLKLSVVIPPALGAASFIPGVSLTGRVLSVHVSVLDVTYRIAETTVFGNIVMAIYLLALLEITVRFAMAWRRKISGAAAYCIALSVLVLAGFNDVLVWSGLSHAPFLLSVAYVVPIAVAVLWLTGRVVRDAAVLSDLSVTLEHKVEERTQALTLALERLRCAQEQSIQTQKMAGIGQLAAGVAHEINNPLGVILGFAQGMERRVPEGDPLRLPVSSIAREAIRCKNLVQELLTFSRTTKKATEPVDLNTVVRSVAGLLESRAKTQGIRVLQELADGLPVIIANNTQVQQVLVNLANNAMDAMPAEGLLTLRTHQDGHRAVIMEVVDTGTGIPEEIRSRVFDPFFTTKEVGKGTGLGLSLIHEIVFQHGGSIDVQSEVGKGTTMCVRFLAAAVGQP
ncbi:MAG: hypothetical protein A2341_15335 [Deltaproteobacteria bacterium RIFOXYB12_FULL_58_9]|nr:MAG: hypothetical protein A2341_15335 [Deltaproteobacteria bacterium RIFOXYB12_FULL_58_9]